MSKIKNQPEEKIISKRRELDELINWGRKNLELNDKNTKVFKNLLYAKITCMSHEVKITPGSVNGLVKHYDREEMREYLKNYVNKKLEEKI
jgi:hypothetical protein